jgi:hypothetical protein
MSLDLIYLHHLLERITPGKSPPSSRSNIIIVAHGFYVSLEIHLLFIEIHSSVGIFDLRECILSISHIVLVELDI